MSGSGKYWRDAGTVILAAKSDTSRNGFDYEVLLLQRSGSMRFHSDTYVSPGGVISDADSDDRWSHLFSGIARKSISEVSSTLSSPDRRPPI